tara:strand:+ start:1759 stop:2769 length:1011 start_codon:yes stop_codon:yes gene_type:complete
MIAKSYEISKKPSFYFKYNLFLLYGENEGLKKEIKFLIAKNKQDAELLSFYENNIISDKEKFYNTIYSASLFTKEKIIIINGASDKIFNEIEEISEKFPVGVCMIIISNILDKKSKLRNFFEKEKQTLCVPCYLDNNRDLEIIARNELRKNNISLSQESVNLLIEKSNSDRNNLKNEIDKIKAFSMNNKNLEIDNIKSLINFSGEYKSDSFVNECLSGNVLEYKKILSELYENTLNQTFFFRIMSNKINRLLNIKKTEKKYNDLDGLLNALKPPIFWKEKPIVKKQLNIWKTSDLKNIISEINKAELLCKKNPQVSKIVFFNFFTRICKKASSYSL